MAKSKKVLSLALAVVMAISMLSIGAFAATTTPTATVKVSASKTEDIQKGEIVTVTVAATASVDYFVGPTSVPVTYNSNLFEVSTADADLDGNPDAVKGANLFGEGTTEVVSNVTTKDGTGTVTAVITPLTTGDPQATNLNNNGQDVVLYTFELTAIADSGSCDVAVVNDQKTADHRTGKLYITSFDKADVRNAELTEVGQTLNGLDTAKVTLNIGSAVQPADLALTDQGTADGVKIDTRIKFGGQYAGVVYGFNQAAPGTFRTNSNYIKNSVQATNGGTIEIARSFNTVGWSTGTTITVKNSDGSDADKVYIVVIFGDVNFDGLINNADITLVKSYSLSESNLTALGNPKSLVVRMAANCQKIANSTMLYRVNNADITALKAYVLGTSVKVSQADLATTIYGLASVNANYQ